jgi:hypothetical protein
MKAATLESRFPLMAVEHGCIISKDADITVAYRVELPEVFTLTRAEYEAPPFHMGEGCPGLAELQYRPQAGHLHRGELQARHLPG